jgi:hypothetical protein
MIAPAVANVGRNGRNLFAIELIAEWRHHPAAYYDLGGDIIRQFKEWIIAKRRADPAEPLLAVTDKAGILHEYLLAIVPRLALSRSRGDAEGTDQQCARYNNNRCASPRNWQGLDPPYRLNAYALHYSVPFATDPKRICDERENPPVSISSKTRPRKFRSCPVAVISTVRVHAALRGPGDHTQELAFVRATQNRMK